jgi:hypothetical protein
LSLTVTAILFLALSTLLRSRPKAGLITSLVVLGTLSFGHITGLIAVWTGGLFKLSLFLAMALGIGLASFIFARTRQDLDNVTRGLNIVAAALVVLNAASIGGTFLRRPRIGPAGPPPAMRRSAESRPNIYYIVLDAYTRADVLEEVFAFDNGPFLAALEARGFTIADRSCANYSLTPQSLASSLNFTFLDGVARTAGTASSDLEPLYAMIRDNRAMALLKDQGYRIITVSSAFEPTDFRTVDRYFGFARSRSEFRTMLLNTTPWPLFFGSGRSAESYDLHRGRILNAFRALAESAYEKGPFFMFVHIMAPHPPFVFGLDGEPVNPGGPFTMLDADRLHRGDAQALSEYRGGYRDQLAFLNTKILEGVEAILSRSAEPPVIVLQGDHGSRALADLDRPDRTYLRENLAILNAYHLPGPRGGTVYPGISPVNTFRLIFKRYFGADLDFLDDRSAWCAWRRPYRFIPYDEGTYGIRAASFRAAFEKAAPEAPKR